MVTFRQVYAFGAKAGKSELMLDSFKTFRFGGFDRTWDTFNLVTSPACNVMMYFIAEVISCFSKNSI